MLKFNFLVAWDYSVVVTGITPLSLLLIRQIIEVDVCVYWLYMWVCVLVYIAYVHICLEFIELYRLYITYK